MVTRHLAIVKTLQYVPPGPATSNILHLVAIKIIPCISVDSSSSTTIVLSFGVFLHSESAV